MNYLVPDAVNEPLYVVTSVFNAPRYKARLKHYHRFAKYVKDSGGVLVTIEAAFGERTHSIEPLSDVSAHPHPGANGRPHGYIQVRTNHELWIKENLLNLAIQRLPADWKYVAWIDADVQFARPNWVGETIHQLQHYKMVQMFTRAQDLGPNHHPTHTTTFQRAGFVDNILNGKFKANDPTYYGGRGASGLAWAARRDAIDDVGGLMDFCILGSADWHQVHALFGLADKSFPRDISSEYQDRILRWQDLAERHIRHNVGTVEGLVLHFWHGKKIDRKYSERWKVLVDTDYRPSVDLKSDWQGVYALEDDGTPRSIALRDGIRDYFRTRNEDSIDV